MTVAQMVTNLSRVPPSRLMGAVVGTIALFLVVLIGFRVAASVDMTAQAMAVHVADQDALNRDVSILKNFAFVTCLEKAEERTGAERIVAEQRCEATFNGQVPTTRR